MKRILVVLLSLLGAAPTHAQSRTDTVAVLVAAVDTVASLHFDRDSETLHLNQLVLHNPQRGIHVSLPAAAAMAQTLGLPMRLVSYDQYDCFRPRPEGRRVCRTPGADGMLLPNLRSVSPDSASVFVSYDRNVTADDGTLSAYRGTRIVTLRRTDSGWVVTEVGTLVS